MFAATSSGSPDCEEVCDRDRLAGYTRVCGWRLSDVVPPTYPHVLAFPLQMQLMADRGFPFALPGLVHVRNVIQQHRPVMAGEPLDLRVHAEQLRPHRSGRQFDLVSTVGVAGEEVWAGRATYLARGRGDAAAPVEGPDLAEPGPARATWRVPSDVGRRYAAVAGDINPIHLHPLAARMLGFPRTIAHGMWVKARALAALEGRLPGALVADATFQRPLLLPSTVELATAQRGQGWEVVVRRPDGASHLVMAVGGPPRRRG